MVIGESGNKSVIIVSLETGSQYNYCRKLDQSLPRSRPSKSLSLGTPAMGVTAVIVGELFMCVECVHGAILISKDVWRVVE